MKPQHTHGRLSDAFRRLNMNNPSRLGALTLETKQLNTMDQVHQLLHDLRPIQGWIQTLDEVSPWMGQRLARDLLCAELILDSRRSVHLRQVQRGWSAVIAREEEDAQGHHVLVRVRHLGREGFGSLLYDVYWDTKTQPDAPIFARLVDTKKDEGP